jgi:hypothetical protein
MSKCFTKKDFVVDIIAVKGDITNDITLLKDVSFVMSIGKIIVNN